MNKYKIGLEIHVQLNTENKLFTSSIFDSQSLQNNCVTVFDSGTPGTFPSINKDAILLGIKTAKLLKCKIAEYVTFDRKHYYYPDLPCGYQITQQENPIGKEGKYSLYNKDIRIDNIHIECDAGKTKKYGKKTSLDFNRCGVPLAEIVTMPDFESEEDINIFLTLLISDLRANKISNANLEEGNFRVDVNISRILDEFKTSCRYEIKNLNSFKSIKYAIELVKEKLINKTENDKSLTIMYDDCKNKIIEGREKKNSTGYMYMIEPSLYPVPISNYELDSNEEILYTISYVKKIIELDNTIDINLILKVCCNINLKQIFKNCFSKNNNIKPKMLILAISDFSELFNSLDFININHINYIVNLFADGLSMLTEGKILKVDLYKTFEKIFNEEINMSLENYLIKNNIISKEESDEVIINFIKQSEELLEAAIRGKNGDNKAIGFLIGSIRKVFKSMHPNKIKEIINKIS